MARNLEMFVFFGLFLAPLIGAGGVLLLTRGKASGTRLGRGLVAFGRAASGLTVVALVAWAGALLVGTEGG